MFDKIKQQIKALRKRLYLASGYGFGNCQEIASLAAQEPERWGYQELVGRTSHTIRARRALEYLRMQSYIPHQNGVIDLRPVFACHIDGAKFDLRTGLVATANNSIVLESGVDLSRIRNSPMFGSSKHDFSYLPGTYTSIWGLFAHNYGHWMIECLLRLYALQTGCCRSAKLLMPDDLSPVQKESFLACLPDHTEVVYVPRRSRFQVDRFVFLSPPTSGTSFYFPPANHLEYARRRIFERYKLSRPSAPSNRIFISRKKAAYRFMHNQDEVTRLLTQYGFKAHDLEDLSFAEQVTLFYDAEMVVSPHSSGLINLLFAPKHTKVLEISALSPEPSFFSLSQALGQEYYYLFGKEAERSRTFPHRSDAAQRLRELINSNFSVDLHELEAALREMEHD